MGVPVRHHLDLACISATVLYSTVDCLLIMCAVIHQRCSHATFATGEPSSSTSLYQFAFLNVLSSPVNSEARVWYVVMTMSASAILSIEAFRLKPWYLIVLNAYRVGSSKCLVRSAHASRLLVKPPRPLTSLIPATIR